VVAGKSNWMLTSRISTLSLTKKRDISLEQKISKGEAEALLVAKTLSLLRFGAPCLR
jgi:hypothetical protein